MGSSGHSLRKVGIYIDTKNGYGHYVLVMRFSDGTYCWPFLLEDYLNGYAVARSKGVQDLLLAKGEPMPDDAFLAISRYAVTPSLLAQASSLSGRKRIKWAQRRKGEWGGKRPNAGRRRARHEGQYDD